MSFQPVFPLVILIPLCLIFIGLGLYLCVRSLRQAPKGVSKWVLGLRFIALLTLAVFLFNPGQWQAQEDDNKAEWVVMVDTSASMKVLEGEQKRIDRALEYARQVVDHGEAEGVGVKVMTYDKTLHSAIDTSANLAAEGDASLLETSGQELLQQYSSSGRSLGGVIVLSDGRQTSQDIDETFFMKAKASATAFHTYTVGQDFPTADIGVSSPYQMVSAFSGQTVQLTAHVDIQHSDQKVATLELLDKEGKAIESVKVNFAKNNSVTHTFTIAAPENSSFYTLRVSKLENEVRLSNNETKVNVRILQSKTKVFIAEGAPYWDSKFLAQLLRSQKHMEVTAVYRLSSSRWFMINSAQAKPFETDQQIFPDSVEKLAEYDLVVLGKNIDGFLTPEIASNLRQYVRDHGGAVLFSRGKSFSSEWSALANLEPVNWTNDRVKQFRLLPTEEGENIGLFGQALPSKESSIWGTLPPLKDAYAIDTVKPFTRVLANGKSATSTFPLLMVRRYGQGVSALLNADGIWKWDFYPEVKSQGNMYNEFWSQLMQWMASYSEFLPGYEHSLHLSSSVAKSGDVVAVKVGFRGSVVPEGIQLEVTSPRLEDPLKVIPTKSIAQDGRVEWRTTLKYNDPGVYKVRLITKSETPLPETNLTIEAPPAEVDQLSADPDYMATVARETAGQVVTMETLKDFLETNVKPKKASIENGQITWHSMWMHWLVALLLIALLGTEWWLRRRNGLL